VKGPNDLWPTVVKALEALSTPVNHADVRRMLDLIASEKVITRKQLIEKHAESARRYRRWLADLSDMREIANPNQCQELWEARARYEEEEVRYWKQYRGELPYRRISQLRIVGVWFLFRGSLEPKQARPFFEAAHEYALGIRAPTKDPRYFEKLLQEFRGTVVDEFKRRPFRPITPFGTAAR
jgi:hypothetical protein